MSVFFLFVLLDRENITFKNWKEMKKIFKKHLIDDSIMKVFSLFNFYYIFLKVFKDLNLFSFIAC